MDRGDWWATVHGVTKSWTQLSNFIFTYFLAYSDILTKKWGRKDSFKHDTKANIKCKRKKTN